MLLAVAAQTEAAGFRRLEMINGKDTRLGSLGFRLSNPDDADKPTAWEGPLTISQGGKSCTADISLVTDVYASSERSYAIVVSYSGSNTFVDFINVSTCAPKWPELKAFTADLRVKGDRLSMLPGCEAGGDKLPAACSSAHVYELSSDTAPRLLKEESYKLTLQTLGVGFSGEAKVAYPKTAHARLVP
jgi:hypothetical protein